MAQAAFLVQNKLKLHSYLLGLDAADRASALEVSDGNWERMYGDLFGTAITDGMDDVEAFPAPFLRPASRAVVILFPGRLRFDLSLRFPQAPAAFPRAEVAQVTQLQARPEGLGFSRNRCPHADVKPPAIRRL